MRVERFAAWGSLACLCAALVSLAACTAEKKLREAELASIEHWLPGVYDNAIQIQDDSVATHEPTDLVIVRVSSMMIGKVVFYEQQFATGNPRRVLQQRLHRFEVSEDGKQITHSMLSLREPARWTTGYQRPEIFKSLMPDDVTPGNCPLEWKKEEGKFIGTNSGPCRANTSSGRPALLQTRLELTELELTVSENLVNSAGEAISDGRDPEMKFIKKAG
jgi:hypothetical protein